MTSEDMYRTARLHEDSVQAIATGDVVRAVPPSQQRRRRASLVAIFPPEVRRLYSAQQLRAALYAADGDVRRLRFDHDGIVILNRPRLSAEHGRTLREDGC